MVARRSGASSSSPTSTPRPSSSGGWPTAWPHASRVAALLTEAEPDLLVHFTFPEAHRRQIRSTNPQERLNKEIKRRTAVGFPDPSQPHPLVGMVLFEQDDEWQDGRRYFLPESMARIDAVTGTEEVEPDAAHGELTDQARG